MAKARLTERFVASASAPPGERLEIFDQHTRGLVLRVTDRGVKSWAVRYRTLDGRQPRLTLGAYPAVDLSKAREAALTVVAAAQRGEDPASDRKRMRAEAQAQAMRSMNDLATAYFAACESGEYRPRRKVKRASTLAGERGLWARHIAPYLGALRIEDVDRAVVRGLLRSIKAPVQGNRCRALLRQVFNWAVLEERVLVNPVLAVPAPTVESSRRRTLTDNELERVWQGLLAPERLKAPDGGRVYVSRPVCIALQLAMLTLQRRSEVASMHRSELVLDQSLWVIAPERTKHGKPHAVPLTPRAVELIREAIRLADIDGPADHVFPSPRDRSRPITGPALTHALRAVYAALGVHGATVHDLRRTGASALTSERLGVSPFIRSQVIGHTTDAGGGAAVSLVYDVNSYMPEKRRALAGWERLLLQVVGEETPPAEVVALRA